MILSIKNPALCAKIFSLLFSTSPCPNPLAKLPRHYLSLPIASLRQVNESRYGRLETEIPYPGRENFTNLVPNLVDRKLNREVNLTFIHETRVPLTGVERSRYLFFGKFS